MIELVKDLEEQGQTDKNNAIANTTQKLDILNAKEEDMNTKQNALQDATDKQTATKAAKDQAEADEKQKRGLLHIASKKLNASKIIAADKENSLNEITARVHEEKKAFKKILDLFDSVIVPESFLSIVGRNLLASDEANPDAVNAVKQKVVDLDSAADQEVVDATSAHDSAQAVLKTDQAAWDKASAAHVLASGALNAATKEYTEAVAAFRLATTAHDLAVKVHDEARLVYQEAVAVKDATLDRVQKEAESLAAAKELLKT